MKISSRMKRKRMTGETVAMKKRVRARYHTRTAGKWIKRRSPLNQYVYSRHC
jgi:hypothetical protein